jgi:hypothetical protein
MLLWVLKLLSILLLLVLSLLRLESYGRIGNDAGSLYFITGNYIGFLSEWTPYINDLF